MRLILAAALCALIASPAAAQRAGTYGVEGAGADGSRYQGTVRLAPTGPTTWRLTWRVAGETIQGIGVSNGRTLAVGYNQGGTLGTALYEVLGDGSLAGTWTSGTEGGTGTERLLPR